MTLCEGEFGLSLACNLPARWSVYGEQGTTKYSCGHHLDQFGKQLLLEGPKITLREIR